MASNAWKVPPLVKVYEAMGALGDGRVALQGGTSALVTSSEGTKTYQVEVSADLREVSSNDNASYWQGYLGYPAIATLLARGLYRTAADVVDALSGIPWKELNRRFRNDYAKTLEEVDRIIAQNGHDPDAVRAEAEAVTDALRKLAPLKSGRKRPPVEKPASKRP